MRTVPARDLLRIQMDDVLTHWRAAKLPKAPPSGWARAIRSALCMSAPALARRLGITERAVRKLETSEADGSISLATLHRLADALNCDLQYALVPRKPLEELVLERAREVAEAQFQPVAHTMALEDQAVAGDRRKKQIEAWAAALARDPKRDLW